MLLTDLETGLHDAERLEPSFCTVCALSVPADFPEDVAAFVELQSQNGDLWDTCMRNLVARRTSDQNEQLRARLQENIDTCERRHLAHDALLVRWHFEHIVDAVVLFRALLCVCLIGSLYCVNPLSGHGGSVVLARAQDPRKRFRSSSGLWPTTPDQLFPYGPARTLSALVGGCFSDEDDGCWWVLTAVMQLARPRVLPILMYDNTLHSFLSCAAVRVITHGTHVRVGLQMKDPDSTRSVTSHDVLRDRYWLRSGRGLKIVAAFLLTIREGPYTLPDDMYNFLLPLLHGFRDIHNLALQKTVSSPQNADWQSIAYCLMPASAHMHEARQLIPDSDVLAAVARNPRAFTVVTVIQLALIALFSEKHCSGPACTRTALDEETDRPPLPTCARCKLARYCSRECQRGDWARGHKHICPVLAALESVAHASTRASAYFSTIEKSGIPDTDLALVGRWAVCRSQHYRDIIRLDLMYPHIFNTTRQQEGYAPVPTDSEAMTRFENLFK